MPSRAEKSCAYACWHVCFARHTRVQRWTSDLENLCETSQGSRAPVAFRSKGLILVELRWPREVKYDAVQKFLRRFAGASEECPPQYSVEPCREDPTADVPVSVPVASPASEPSAGAVSSLALAPPASAPSPAAPAAAARLPPGLMLLKLQDIPPHLQAQDFAADWKSPLGRGTFGQVYKGKQNSTGASVAVKTFLGRQDALREVAVLAGLPPHPSVLRILDVGWAGGKMCIVSDVFETDLNWLLRKRPLEDAERAHMLRAMCAGLAHIHQHGLCHADLKPANVFLRGCSLPAERTASRAEFAQWLIQLPQALGVCIGDLGNAVIATPEQRPEPQGQVEEVGICEVTLWYRAPEILLGMESFGCAVDVWALGCTAAEMLRREPLLRRVLPRRVELQRHRVHPR